MRLTKRFWNTTYKSLGFRKVKRKKSAKRPTFQSSFESLEVRQLMTATTTVSTDLVSPISAGARRSATIGDASCPRRASPDADRAQFRYADVGARVADSDS